MSECLPVCYAVFINRQTVDRRQAIRQDAGGFVVPTACAMDPDTMQGMECMEGMEGLEGLEGLEGVIANCHPLHLRD